MGLARRAVCCATADEAARVLERGQGRSDDTAWASKGRSGYDKAGHGPAAGEGEARWDVVLVWTKPRLTAEGGALSVSELRRREAQVQERKQKLEALFAGLESVGLLLSSFKEEAEDGTDARHFMLVAAPHSLTLEAAEAIKMVKRLKPASGDSESKPLYDVYTIEKHDLFAEDAFREGCARAARTRGQPAHTARGRGRRRPLMRARPAPQATSPRSSASSASST